MVKSIIGRVWLSCVSVQSYWVCDLVYIQVWFSGNTGGNQVWIGQAFSTKLTKYFDVFVWDFSYTLTKGSRHFHAQMYRRPRNKPRTWDIDLKLKLSFIWFAGVIRDDSFIINGPPAFEEDKWGRFSITHADKELQFTFVHPCARCKVSLCKGCFCFGWSKSHNWILRVCFCARYDNALLWQVPTINQENPEGAGEEPLRVSTKRYFNEWFDHLALHLTVGPRMLCINSLDEMEWLHCPWLVSNKFWMMFAIRLLKSYQLYPLRWSTFRVNA